MQSPLTSLIQLVLIFGQAFKLSTSYFINEYKIATYAKPFCVPTSIYLDSNMVGYVTDDRDMTVRNVVSNSSSFPIYAGMSATFGNSDLSSGDGSDATSALLNKPWDTILDSAGNVYISDLDDNKIRKVNAITHIIATIAGNGEYSYCGDGGSALNACLAAPSDLFLSSTGFLYVADSGNNRIRKINLTTLNISTVAGSGTVGGFSGDNGPATSATLSSPRGVWGDSIGDIYIADTFNSRIRKVSPGGIITTIAGTSVRGYNGDGIAATSSELNLPYGVAGDSYGNLFIADKSNDVIRIIPQGSNNTLYVLAGTPKVVGYTGDGGYATSATMAAPVNVFVDHIGNIYVAEMGNKLIRLLTPPYYPSAMPTTVPTPHPTAKPSMHPTVRPTAIPSTTPTTTPTSVPTSIVWILGFTNQNCDQVCFASGNSHCVPSYFKEVDTLPTFELLFNISVFLGTCLPIGSTVNSILLGNVTVATEQSYCNGGINYVAHLATDPMAYTYQSIVGHTNSSDFKYTYLTRCGYPNGTAEVTGTCSSNYDATPFLVQRWCPCDAPCNLAPNPLSV